MARFTKYGFTFGNATSFGAQTGDRQIIDIKALGTKEVAAILKTLPDKTLQKCFRKALKGGVEKLFADVQSQTPVGKTGKMKESLKKQFRLNKKTGYLSGGVTARGRVAPHFHLVDLGWNLTGHAPDKKFIRRIKDRNIMKGAVDKNSNGIIEEFVKDLRELALEAQADIAKGKG